MSVLMGNTIDNSGPFHRSSIRSGQTPVRSQSASEHGAAQATDRRGPKHGSHQHEGHVSFSDSVAVLQRMQNLIDAEPAVHSDKVSAARTAIHSGTYQIDHAQIATRLIAIDKELP